jgi:hypothetical protein
MKARKPPQIATIRGRWGKFSAHCLSGKAHGVATCIFCTRSSTIKLRDQQQGNTAPSCLWLAAMQALSSQPTHLCDSLLLTPPCALQLALQRCHFPLLGPAGRLSLKVRDRMRFFPTVSGKGEQVRIQLSGALFILSCSQVTAPWLHKPHAGSAFTCASFLFAPINSS